MILHCTFDFFTLAASNSLVAFCFCNLIIAILLVASSKPSSSNADIDEENPLPPSAPLPGIAPRKNCVTDDTTSLHHYYSNTNKSAEAPKEVGEAASPSDAVIISCEDKKSPDDEEEEYQNEEADDDELRRRVEEFIAKVNRGWKAENLRTYAS